VAADRLLLSVEGGGVVGDVVAGVGGGGIRDKSSSKSESI
jgi:hypothetical protein